MEKIKSLKKIVFIFLIFTTAHCSTVFCGESCSGLFSQSEINSLCSLFVSKTRQSRGDNPSIIAEIERLVFSKIKINSKTVSHNADECYKIKGVQISLFYEDEKNVKIDKFLSYGDTSSTIIDVKSCTHSETQNGREIFADLSVHVFLNPIEPDAIVLSTEKRTLKPGETCKIRASLKCGDCYLSGHKLLLKTDDSGKIVPEECITDKRGNATALFKLLEDKESKVTAFYKDLESVVVIYPEGGLWGLKVTVEENAKSCLMIPCSGNGPVDYRNLRYEVRFSNIPLTRYVSDPWNLNTPKNFSSNISVKGERKMLKFKPTSCDSHWERIRVDYSTECGISFGILSDKDMNPILGINTFAMKNYDDMFNPRHPRFPSMPFLTWTGLLLDLKQPLPIPAEKIRSASPFKIEYTYKAGDSCSKEKVDSVWTYTFEFYPEKMPISH